MVTLLCGEEKYLLDLELNKIMLNYEEEAIISYDFMETSIEDILLGLKTYSIFSEKFLIVVKNFSALAELDKLQNYLDKGNFINELVLYSYSLQDKRKKFIKTLQSKFVYKEFNKHDEKDLSGFVVSNLNKYNITISEVALKEIVKRSNNDLTFLVNQINKLACYKEEGENINLEDVNLFVSEDFTQKIYDLSELVLNGKKTQALELYNNLKNYFDEFALVALLGKNLRNIMLAQAFDRYRLGNPELAKVIGVTPGHLYFIKQQMNYRVRPILEKIAELDLNIKSGKLDKKIAFELFLVGI